MESLISDDNMAACRVCLSDTSENRFKFEVESEWSHLFEYCVGLTITKDSTPLVLCNGCATKLRDYAQFKTQCLQSDMMWKQLPYSVKNEKWDESQHHDFDSFDNSLHDFSDSVKPETYPISNSYSENLSETTDITARPLKVRKSSKKKTSKNLDLKKILKKEIRKKSSTKSKLNKIKNEFDDTDMELLVKKPKRTKKDEFEASDLESLVNKRTKRPKRGPVIPMKITPYTDEEKLERRVISKNTDIQKYLESIGKADEKYMSEKEFLHKYYKQCSPEISKKTSKLQAVFGCRKCDKKLKSKKTLVNHTKVCSDEELNVILDHELKVLLRGPTLPVAKFVYCGICQFTSESCDIVNDHWREHVVNNMLDCKICTYTGRDMADMVAHRFKHHPANERHWIRCPICSLCQMQVNKLEYHYRSVHLNKKGGLCCYCEKEFVDYRSWICHQIKHTVDRFICDHCGRNFMHRHDIEYHLDIVFGTKKYTCETCGKGFKRMSNLRLHIRGKHTENEPLKCNHCDRMFKNKHTYSNHLWEINRPKCFCEVCGKELYKNELKNHMMKHTGERPFKCDMCTAGFIKMNQLKTHMRVHTGLKPFSCQVCQRAFSSSKSLKGHEKTHTASRTVKCPYCERTFYEAKRMRYHCKVKHQIIIKDEPN